MKVKVIPFTAENWQLLPPRPGLCQKCGRDHEADMPHDARSLTYQYWFYLQHKRWPCWADAMAHCSEEMKAKWIAELAKIGITPEKL